MFVENENPDNEEDSNKTNNPSVGAGGGSATVGGPTNTSQGNPSTISPVQNNQPQQKWATVQDYLGANKTQGEQLGQNLTSNLTNTALNEKSAIDTAADATKQAASAGTTGFNSDLVNQAASNPTSVTGDTNKLQDFLKQWNSSYTGPSSFETSDQYTPAITAASEANTKATQLNDQGGRESLIGEQYGVYGQGNKGLDQALVQNSSAFPELQNIQKQFGSVQDYLTSKAADVNSATQAAQATSDATKTNTQNAFNNSLSNFQNDLNSRVATAKNTATTAQAKYQQDLASGNPEVISTDLKAMGVPADQITNVANYLSALNKDYKVNPDVSNAYSYNSNVDVNPANVATNEDYAKAAALQKLTGVNYGGVLNPADAAKAGTANLGATSGVNSAGISNQLKTQLTQQDSALLSAPVPPLGNALKNMTDATESTQFAQKYIDAMQRQGQPINSSNPIIQNLFNQARSEYMKYSGRPDVQAGMQGILKVVGPYILNTNRG